MNGFLMVQLIIFIAFIGLILDAIIQAAVKRIFPSWSRGICVVGAGFLVGVVLFSTVPGRARHLDFVKQIVMDEVAAKEFNGGGTGFRSWLGNTVSGLAADVLLQGMRVEKHFGLISVGYMETDAGWTPVSVGFAGIVCRNFFMTIPIYDMPSVSVAIKEDVTNGRQVELKNDGDVKYTCSVSLQNKTSDPPICEFVLDAHSPVRIQQEKKGIGNKLKKLLNTDKTLVVIPSAITPGLCIAFKDGRRLMKQVELLQVNGEIKVLWIDPR